MILASQYAAFALTFAASAATPGPEVAALLGRSLAGRPRRGGPLATGIITGKLLLLGLAAAGLATLGPVLGPALVVLRYAGAGYLCWLGARRWVQAGAAQPRPGRFPAGSAPARSAPAGPRRHWATGPLSEAGLGLAMTLSNPIALAFYLALLPAVVDVTRIRLLDYLVLAAIVVAVMALVAAGYGRAGSVLARRWADGTGPRRAQRVSAVVFVAAGLWIALR